MLLTASSGRMLLFNTGLIAPKATKSTQGVAAMTLKKGQRVLSAVVYQEGDLQNPARFKKAAGARRAAERRGRGATRRRRCKRRGLKPGRLGRMQAPAFGALCRKQLEG